MGGYSDSEEDYRKSKKKKKRSSRSRSRSSEGSYSSYSSSKKHKKSKKKHRKRSPAPARSRSGSRDRYYSPRRTSVSPRPPRRRSRSPRRRSRSRSWERSHSNSRRSSRDRDRYASRRSRSRSRSRTRRRSRTRSTSRRRSRSPRSRRSRSRSRDRKTRSELPDEKDPSKIVPGWDQMSSSEQAEARLQLALKAAANVDENLREQGLLAGVRKSGGAAAVGSSSNSPLLTFEDRVNRTKAISDIESSGFAQTAFKSSKSQRQTGPAGADDAHDAAIFGGEIELGAGGEMPILSFSRQPLKDKDTESLMHPNLYVSAEEKMDRWIAKLKAFRRQKLEGKLLK